MHRALADETRTKLMRMLRSAPSPQDARQLAEQLGLHLTTVRAHLDVLAEAGLVTSEAEDRAMPGPPRKLYRAAGGAQILLHRCPFMDIARDHQDVVCSVHLGIMQGALQTLGAALEARALEPFVQPSLCVAHLAEAATGTTAAGSTR